MVRVLDYVAIALFNTDVGLCARYVFDSEQSFPFLRSPKVK